jgi:membrane protein involved in colicin uptake
MRDLKQTGFTDRITAQQDAKKALLERFKPKPAAPDPEFDKLAAKRAAEKEALRQQHELAKAERRREKAEQEAARLAAERDSQEAVEAEKRAARKERKQLTKEEQKAARDARYAARKARGR